MLEKTKMCRTVLTIQMLSLNTLETSIKLNKILVKKTKFTHF